MPLAHRPGLATNCMLLADPLLTQPKRASAGVLCGAAASGGFAWTPENVAKSATCMLMSGPLLTGYTQTINDYFDREIDAINEPNRPIPSGACCGKPRACCSPAACYIVSAASGARMSKCPWGLVRTLSITGPAQQTWLAADRAHELGAEARLAGEAGRRWHQSGALQQL